MCVLPRAAADQGNKLTSEMDYQECHDYRYYVVEIQDPNYPAELDSFISVVNSWMRFINDSLAFVLLPAEQLAAVRERMEYGKHTINYLEKMRLYAAEIYQGFDCYSSAEEYCNVINELSRLGHLKTCELHQHLEYTPTPIRDTDQIIQDNTATTGSDFHNVSSKLSKRREQIENKENMQLKTNGAPTLERPKRGRFEEYVPSCEVPAATKSYSCTFFSRIG